MSKEGNTYKKRRTKQISVKWKMFAILICFVTIFAIIIWVFEIYMLNFFYQTAKFAEIKNTATSIELVIDDEETVRKTAKKAAEEYYNDIWVYKLDENKAENVPIVYEYGTRDKIGFLLENKFEFLYESTVKNEGSYVALIPMKNFKETFNFTIVKDNMGSSGNFPYIIGNPDEITVVYMKILAKADNSYLIVQAADIEPVGAMVQTVQNQVFFISGLLLLFSFLMAYLMARLITTPIVKINQTAKNLAHGRYNIEFSGHGYREIEELSDTLNYASKELSKNDALQKEIIANVSHDLRTPLTMIKGYGEVMRDIPGENTPENIQVIIDETSRLTDLVNDMFDISKIQSGTRAPELKAFCLTQAVRSALQRYERLITQDGYKIEFRSDEDVFVYADSTMILQVIYNFINNAVNYTGEDKQIIVSQSVKNNTVRISISDTGEGISEENIPHIWDRYYKVDKVHRRATVGSGLGLSIVKGILELHHASYGVTSTVGKGSTFWFEMKTVDSEEYKAELVKF